MKFSIQRTVLTTSEQGDTNGLQKEVLSNQQELARRAEPIDIWCMQETWLQADDEMTIKGYIFLEETEPSLFPEKGQKEAPRKGLEASGSLSERN